MAARLTTARGRWLAAAAGLVCVAVVGWLGLRWRELHVRYLLGRLDAAQGFDEAKGVLEQAT